MKKILLLLMVIATFIHESNAQIKLNDFGRIILNTYLPDNISIPSEAKRLLETKLSQIASNNGMGGSQVNPRFIITAAINIGTKDIIAGPPQMISQNIDITLFVGDRLTNTIFSNTTLSLKGVENNENKAFIAAFKLINPKSKQISTFLSEGKNKIISYYTSNCDFVIKEAYALVKQEKYDEAIYQLSIIPEVCHECYFKCLDALAIIYQQKIDTECTTKLNIAKTVWMADQNQTGAKKVGAILMTIKPMAKCQPEVASFIGVIDAKLKADEKARWEFEMKQYADQVAAQKEQVRIAEIKSKRDDKYREDQASRNSELDRISVDTYREVAVEYLRNQPKTVTYNNIYWR